MGIRPLVFDPEHYPEDKASQMHSKLSEGRYSFRNGEFVPNIYGEWIEWRYVEHFIESLAEIAKQNKS